METDILNILENWLYLRPNEKGKMTDSILKRDFQKADAW